MARILDGIRIVAVSYTHLVARGKKQYDKRHDIAKRDADRRMQQAMRR